jgi:hypothetical protein
MDMMHSLNMVVAPMAPTGLTAVSAGTPSSPKINLSWTDNSLKEAQYNIERATNTSFTTQLVSLGPVTGTTATTGSVTFSDTRLANNAVYYYRVFAVGNPVGDTAVYAGSTNGFPTMSANAVSNTASIQLGTPVRPANPITPTATLQIGPQVTLTWVDKANNENGFNIQRCAGSGCVNFVTIATISNSPGINSTVTYIDTTVGFNTTYRYQIYAVNSAGQSLAATPPVSVTIPVSLSAPTNYMVAVASVTPNYRATSTWNWAGANPTNFTIQRANNSTFTTGLLNSTIAPGMRINNQIVSPATTYYYRIRANNAAGSSPWTNALPFPIRTGN